MGNCIESCKNFQETEITFQEEEEEVKKENVTELEKNGNMRVKIVLTKDELEWLMFQLKDTQGKSLEDVLGEIQRSRLRVVETWKPTLESIIESPNEVPESMEDN